ncbi:MAG TPA: serine/threonine-protein kinase [Planctomycetota bacterium]|jgi:tetratricopeptide (TPR) repeat protein|nr:serine/threonine-protein kinase [Planctomycetota bacterium]
MKPAPISVEGLPSKAKDETAELLLPRMPNQIGPYKILRLIGRGGMGSVYRAQVVVSCQVPIGAEVALKLLRETEDKERKRFAREAAYLQALRHPGIVRVLDNGEYQGQPYLVMQLVEGRHADDLLISGKPNDQNYITDLTIQALDALHVAHLHGILHRDIKPGNIMISEGGQVKLVDFGLAQYMNAAESHLTATGAVVGTPAYMSPEQASGRREEISRRSDVYSMGACLYELLTGKQPFEADNSVALLRCIIEEPLTPPSAHRKDLARDLETIVLKAMAKDWRDRYATAEAMAADLRRFRLGVRIRTARPNFLRPLLRAAWQQRSSLTLVALMAFIAVSATALVVRAALKRAAEAGAAATVLPTTTETVTSSVPTEVVVKRPVAPTDPWVEVLHQDLALDEPMSPLGMTDAGALGKDFRRTVMPTVSGPVRLSATVELLDAECMVDLMVSDPDIGKGYRVRISATQANDRLELLREDKVVRSRDLGQLVRGRPLRLSIERDGESIVARLDRREPLRFLDLIPVESLVANRVQIVFPPQQVKVSQVQLERQRTNLYVSALALPDMMRQSKYYSAAKDEYENFIKDHPEAPEVRDAHLRIALCLERMDTPATDELALAKFNEVASIYRDDRSYVLTATFHAWSCALRLGRIQAAEEFFEAIRRDFDLASLLPTIPEATIKDLVKDYLTRADQLTESEPERAARLFINGADIASYLNQPKAAAEAQGRAGDLLVSQGLIEDAVHCYTAVITDDRIGEGARLPFRMRLAQAERLRNRLDNAEAAYQAIIKQPVPVGDLQQWARLWLGDLALQRGDIPAATAIWDNKGSEEKTLPGRIMRNLCNASAPLPVDAKKPHAGDIAYFNARLAQMRGRSDEYRANLELVVKLAPVGEWPVLLANRLLEQSAYAQPPVVPLPDDEPLAAPTTDQVP